MVQAQERKASQSKGFDPKQSQQQPEAGQAPSGVLPLEIAALHQQVTESLFAQYQAFEAIKAEYAESAQKLSDYMTQETYAMLTGSPVFSQAAQNLGKLMAQHPRMQRPTMQEMRFTKLSLRPYEPGISSVALLNSRKEND